MLLKKIGTKIYEIKGCRVMLDFDLALLYKTETRILKQAVKRNKSRFPKDFMFVLSKADIELMVSQNVIPSKSYLGGSQPFAFTEQGVAMLSSILNSPKAIQVNIAIMRAFVTLRQFAMTNDALTQRLKEIETKYDKQFTDVYEAIGFLLQREKGQIEQSKREKIGYRK